MLPGPVPRHRVTALCLPRALRRPPRRPRARADARPACARSRITARSNSASAPEDTEHRLTRARLGVNRLLEALQANALGAKTVRLPDQMLRRPAEAVQPPHHQRVHGTQVMHRVAQLAHGRAFAGGTGDHLPEARNRRVDTDVVIHGLPKAGISNPQYTILGALRTDKPSERLRRAASTSGNRGWFAGGVGQGWRFVGVVWNACLRWRWPTPLRARLRHAWRAGRPPSREALAWQGLVCWRCWGWRFVGVVWNACLRWRWPAPLRARLWHAWRAGTPSLQRPSHGRGMLLRCLPAGVVRAGLANAR